jgi:hypothetical protein
MALRAKDYLLDMHESRKRASSASVIWHVVSFRRNRTYRPIEVAAKIIVWGNTMPKRKRVQREHTEDWQTIQQYTLWPEQTAYELLCPVVLFGDPAGKRAQETETAESTLDRKADTFDEQGMVSLFASRPRKQHKRQHGVFRPICVS